MKRYFALFAALLLTALALSPLLTVSTSGAGEPYPDEQPAVVDKLPGEDVPASGCAYLEEEPLGLFRVTAYCPLSCCCGRYADGITATGTAAVEGRTVAVDPEIVPYGSALEVIYEDGSRARYVAEDCGAGVRAQSLDVFFKDHQAAREFGVRTAYVFLLPPEEDAP